MHPDTSVSREIGFQIACAKFGNHAVIGGLSALFYYNLVEQVPQQTWVLVPQEKVSHVRGYRLQRTKADLTKGIVVKDGYKIVTVERAILEALKLSSKLGERTAIGAARKAIAERQTTEVKLGRMAKDIGLAAVLHKYFEAIIA